MYTGVFERQVWIFLPMAHAFSLSTPHFNCYWEPTPRKKKAKIKSNHQNTRLDRLCTTTPCCRHLDLTCSPNAPGPYFFSFPRWTRIITSVVIGAFVKILPARRDTREVAELNIPLSGQRSRWSEWTLRPDGCTRVLFGCVT